MSNIYLPRSQRKALSSVGHTLTPPSRGCHCSPTKKSCYHPGGLTHAYPESEKQLGLRWVANAATSFLPTSHPSLVTWSCDTAAALGSCSADPALPQQPGVPQSLPLAPLVATSPARAACCSLTGAVHVLLMPCNAAEFHPLISPQLINPATETALRLTALCGVLIPKAGKCQIFCLLTLFPITFPLPLPF